MQDSGKAKYMTALRVLYWLSPVTEMQWPFQKIWWVRQFLPRIEASLRKAGYSPENTFLISADLMVLVRKEALELPGDVVAFSQRELLDDYRLNGLDLDWRFQGGVGSADDYAAVRGLVESKLGEGYVPDVVFAMGPAPFLRNMFPAARFFHHEYSVFSRPPYPETFAFDPAGIGRRFLISDESALINSYPARPEERVALLSYRNAVLEALRANDFVTGYFRRLKQQYRRVLLLPLGYENYRETLGGLPHQGQFELVEQVLDSVPQDTCVMVTQHPAIQAIPFSRLEELKWIHPNLVLEEWFEGIPSFSQVAMAYADGCVFDNTSLAYQAAFLGKYLFSLGGVCGGIADGVGVKSLSGFGDVAPKDRINYFAWILRHYAMDASDMPRQLRACLEAGNFGHCATSADVVRSMPAVLSSSELIERLRKWQDELLTGYAEQLRSNVTPMSKRQVAKAERDGLVFARDELTKANAWLEGERSRLEGERVRIEQEHARQTARLESERAAMEDELRSVRMAYDSIRLSRCWRALAPLRAVADLVKRVVSRFRGGK